MKPTDRRRRPAVRHPVLSGLAVLVTVAAGCSIDPDAGPRAVPPDQRGQLGAVEQEAGQSTGTSRVFLVSDDGSGRVLQSVPRDVAETPTDVLGALFAGANREETEAGLVSALPGDGQVLSARQVAGTLNVDLSPEILELENSALSFAVAQIVFTADELDGVRAVRLRVDGESRAWPTGGGELTSSTLTVYDFPGYAESAQPAYPAVPTETVP